MLFTEPAFIFLFLPLTLLAYWVTPTGWRNALLAVASLIFYALGEIRFVAWLLLSIGINYVLALWIERTRNGPMAKIVLAIGISSDLVLLLIFKYSGWLISNIDALLVDVRVNPLAIPELALPLGISFFTFHKISYKIDVYRGDTRAQRNPITLGLYILFFPQLIAGPIVRYHDISGQLDSRSTTAADAREGVRRCIVGLAKKIIIANSMAVVADRIFGLGLERLSVGAAWLGIVCYTLQIYFDFSGYSDMAIGLARLFGFRFLENFDHPYASTSITEFWRRWHISLSRWFRDYLYVPLGGNRAGRGRTYLNLLIVFFLCGLWHGASWEFVVWGLFHGGFLVIERLGFGGVLERLPRPVRHAYALLVVVVGWVFFRAGSLGKALAYLGRMVGSSGAAEYADPAQAYLDRWLLAVLVLGIVTAFPVSRVFDDWLDSASERGPRARIAVGYGSSFGLCALFLLSIAFVAAATYNPFLYFRF